MQGQGRVTLLYLEAFTLSTLSLYRSWSGSNAFRLSTLCLYLAVGLVGHLSVEVGERVVEESGGQTSEPQVRAQAGGARQQGLRGHLGPPE